MPGIAELFLIPTAFFFGFYLCSLGQVSVGNWLRFFWRSTHIRAPKLPLHALLCGSPLDSHDHPNIGTPRQGPRSHWSLHLLLARSQYQLTDWTLLPSAALNHVSKCSQSCANQTHLDTSCCWQYYDVLSYVFIMVSCYRWSGNHPGFMLRFWPYLTPHFLFVLGKNCPKDFSVSKDGSKAHTFDDTTWDT